MLSDYLPMNSEVLHFIKVLSWSLKARRHRFRIAHILGENIVKVLGGIKDIEIVADPASADIVLVNTNSLSDSMDYFVKGLSKHTLLVVLNIIADINKRPELIKELGLAGFTKSILPINGGIAIALKRGYNVNFFKKTVEVYRESFIYGPNPIDYNTASALYILAKFITARRKGTIVEIGTGRGFSTLWLAHAAKETGLHVISLDNKCDRVDYALKVLKTLNLDDHVEILCIDAKSYDHGSKDVVYVFIDGKKDEYHQYLKALEPYLLPGALILAHNTISDAHTIKPYIEKVYAKPYKSITIATDPKGLTISVYI